MKRADQVKAGPAKFGWDELNHAAAERGLPGISVETEISDGRPESYIVTPEKITGGDERGLMYGLLEAADQLRQRGRIESAQGDPSTAIRGIRHFIHNASMEVKWYYSKEYWDAYFAMLARNRLNRFNLVFAAQTNYLSPPYPFWVQLPEFSEVQVPGLSEEQRSRNLEMLCYISQSATDHGVDFTLGVWQHNTWAPGQIISREQTPPVRGLRDKNIGPYSYAALRKVLHECPGIRSVQLRTGYESGIPDEHQLSFYRDWVFRAIRDAGRAVTLDLRSWAGVAGMTDAAINAGVPLRVSVKYWAEHMGRPYPPVETFPRFSYHDLLKSERPYDYYWELWALGSHRLLLWGDPQYVRRAAPTFSLSGGSGFEIDAPLAQKGFGNAPGAWGIFANNRYVSHKDKQFWHWEFERYWMFYLLWGRLTYDPTASEGTWMGELQRRFGIAAPHVLAAYQSAGRVMTEIVAAHLADPNMYIWPEINPGGLIAAYKDVAPSDQTFIASPAEAAHCVLHDEPSAKQGPQETAQLLDGVASEIETAVEKAAAELKDNTEWRGTEPDFQVLAHLARYHARKQEAAYSLSWYYETGNIKALDRAEAELTRALGVWEDLVALTDGLYPDHMIFGPSDFGHWKDKLPYVYNDIFWIRERKQVQERYGSYEFRFEFGRHAPSLPDLGKFFDGDFISRNSVEPRFTFVDPSSVYNDATGHGWYGGVTLVGPSLERRLAPYDDVRAVRSRPETRAQTGGDIATGLPENILFRGSLSLQGGTFRVRTGNGIFEVVMLHPDQSETKAIASAHDGFLDIKFPGSRPQHISALLIRTLEAKSKAAPDERYPKSIPRPDITHTPPTTATAGQPLMLSIDVQPGENVTSIRLHYRTLNALAKVRTLEISGAAASFTLPAEEIVGDFDLLYYFEVLNSDNRGWFHPDPAVMRPYYILKVQRSDQSASRFFLQGN